MPTIIKVEPTEDITSPIQCFSLPDGVYDGPFTALSYVEPATNIEIRSINVDGEEKVISSALYSAIRYLRYPEAARYLWIDSLCIETPGASQDPLESLRCQRAVYESASEIAVWLGDPHNATPQGFICAESCARFERLSITPASVEILVGNGILDPAWASLPLLFSLPWWDWARI